MFPPWAASIARLLPSASCNSNWVRILVCLVFWGHCLPLGILSQHLWACGMGQGTAAPLQDGILPAHCNPERMRRSLGLSPHNRLNGIT